MGNVMQVVNDRSAGAYAFAAMLLVLGGLALPAAAGDGAVAPSPIVAACSNPNLPPEILDGPVAGKATAPLPVVDVTATGLALRLAVANDEVDREQGLMCVTRLRPQHGMIFVFAASQEWDFWMKNTLVPLDMVWVASDGTITGVAAHVPASTRETPDDAVARRSGHGKFVIELADGESATDNLRTGVRLSLPVLHASQ